MRHCVVMGLTLSQRTKLDSSKLKELADHKFFSNLMKMAESSPKGLKTQWEKKKLIVTGNFSFSQCFQKACFPGASKGVIVWEWFKVKISSI